MKTAILTAGELRAWRPNLLLWWVGREAYLLTGDWSSYSRTLFNKYVGECVQAIWAGFVAARVKF